MAGAAGLRGPGSAHRRRWTVAFVGLALLAAACGSRVPHDEALALATGTQPSGSDGAAAPGPNGGGADGALAPGPVAGELEADATAGASGTSGSSDAAVVSGAAPSPGAASGAPIVVGEIGDYSGVIGSALTPMKDAFGAWVNWINARGGINGHPIQLYVADDGNDPARSLAIARDFVENRHVIALVNFTPADGAEVAVSEYAEEQGIPIIGGGGFNDVWWESPVMFPISPANVPWAYARAKVSADLGFEKVAVVHCVEASVCEAQANDWEVAANQLGLDVVYSAGSSLGAPDYTAECLNAQSRGAESIYVILDANSVGRMAVSCARQGYRPTFVLAGGGDPVVPELEGAVSMAGSFPWFLTSGTPALEEWGEALNTYAPGTARNAFAAHGWVAGKLLELVAAGVSETPTSDDLFRGLWRLRGETLGGLSIPLTYTEGQPAARGGCAFLIQVSDGRWTAPNGLTQSACPP